MYFQKTTLKLKISYFEEELAKNRNKPKELCEVYSVTQSKFGQSSKIKNFSDKRWYNFI